MRTAIMGHRGVGKSTCLARIEIYYRESGRAVLMLDLDQEIEKRTGATIDQIFSREGEAAFRDIEKRTFTEIDGETKSESRDVFLVLGGGFDPQLIPNHWRALWVRRSTDHSGRVFMDRPRLNTELPALDEYRQRFEQRHPRFSARADETLWVDEGLDEPDEAERSFFSGKMPELIGAITLFPDQFRTREGFAYWIAKRVGWGLRWFELRDDLLSEEQLAIAIAEIPKKNVLISFRSAQRRERTESLVRAHGFAFDWPIEFGACTFAPPRFLSLHERIPGQSLLEALSRFPEATGADQTCFKAALPTRDFHDLAEGHAWWSQDPTTRTFLPLSDDGRWSWYRLHQGTRLALNFFRESDGSGADQPTLLQWVRRRRIENQLSSRRFAAVLGDPVVHSRTPMEQGAFFATAGYPVYSIRIKESEWDEGALRMLHVLGLNWAAVTTPLKERAFEACKERDELSVRLKAVNTLVWDEERAFWKGTNTDLEGFARSIESLGMTERSLGRIAVWGGGGTLNVVKAVLPDAELFSIRTGENREKGGALASTFDPETVIWAVGRSRDGIGEPPENWKPRLVIDLNYAENSPGRDFALARGCRYTSGLAMFRYQAAAQRRFWEIF